MPAQHAQMSSLDQEACEVIYDFHNARLVAHDIASPLHASRNGSIIQPRFSPRSSPAKQTPAPPSHATSTNNRTEQERADSRAAGAGEALVDQQVPDGVDAGARGHASVGAHNKHGAIPTEGFESGGMKQGESPSAVAMRIAKKVVERQQEQEDKFGPSKREVVERQREEEDKLNPSKRDLGTSMTLKARVRRKEDVGEWVRVAVDKVLVPKIERVPELSLGTVPPVLSGI